jgi:hypothetical protein
VPRKLHGGGVRQRDQTRLNGFHFPVDFGQLLFGFAGVDIRFNALHGGGDPVLIQLAIGTDNIVLLMFDLREDLPTAACVCHSQ